MHSIRHYFLHFHQNYIYKPYLPISYTNYFATPCSPQPPCPPYPSPPHPMLIKLLMPSKTKPTEFPLTWSSSSMWCQFDLAATLLPKSKPSFKNLLIFKCSPLTIAELCLFKISLIFLDSLDLIWYSTRSQAIHSTALEAQGIYKR